MPRSSKKPLQISEHFSERLSTNFHKISSQLFNLHIGNYPWSFVFLFLVILIHRSPTFLSI